MERPGKNSTSPLQPTDQEGVSQDRFRPVSLSVEQRRGRARISPKKSSKGAGWRDWAGYTLEGLVVLAVLAVFGNWLLAQMGISINWLDFGQGSSAAVLPMGPEGPVLNANASGTIAVTVPPTPTNSPTATPIPTGTPTAVLAAGPEAEATKTIAPTPTLRPTATPVPVLAATPTPVIVQPKQPEAGGATAPDDAASIPARRLVIPRIGVDSAIKEVTVDLGTWQVADYVVGHHLGTANPGQNGNMVLVGHRDIRGSIFLRLNELQVGDDFQVYTDRASYHYVINQIYEVAPTEVSVLAPSVDATATLITCTPVGLATRRLIIKARLQN